MKCLKILVAGFLAGGLVVSAATRAALAAPAGVAFIVSNTTYASLPPIQACTLSARAMGSAFKARDFDVNTLSDGSAGQLSGAIGLLTEKLKAIPDVPVAIYFCGYVAARGGRPFLLPISAALERPSDVMTQGILAKSIVDVVAGSGPRASLIMLEAVAVPNAAEPMALASLDRPDLPAGMGLLGVSVTAGDSSLRFVATLLPRLKADAVKIPDLISDFKQDPDGQVTAAILLTRVPSEPAFLFGRPPPPPPPPPPVPPPAPAVSAPITAPVPAAPVAAVAPPAPVAPPTPAAPAPTPEPVPAAPVVTAPAPIPVAVAAPVPAPSVAPPAVAEPVSGFPDEDRMTDAMRRSMQTKLATLGYYTGPIDGLFLTETRAAIRRFQHELQVPMTGRLTGAQAGKLITIR